MIKKLWVGVAVVLISVSASFSAFAGEWKQDTAGWWYDFGDMTYAKDGWHWVGGKCYYFTPEGYCLLNTTTPDGDAVDADGAWIIDGVVQVRDDAASGQAASDGSVCQIGNVTFLLPADYVFYGQSGSSWSFAHKNESGIPERLWN